MYLLTRLVAGLSWEEAELKRRGNNQLNMQMNQLHMQRNQWYIQLYVIYSTKKTITKTGEKGKVINYVKGLRADSRFAPSQFETALLCNDISHWLGASLESALSTACPYQPMQLADKNCC